MEVRRATLDDVLGMVELWKEFMDLHAALQPFWTRDPRGHEAWTGFARQHVEDADKLALVAVEDGQTIGYALAAVLEYPPVLTTSRYGMIRDTAVTAAHRGRGAGRALCEAMEQWFRARGVRHVELHVSTANAGARRFWRRMGFDDFVEKLARELPG
jgi:GNAT superfamily N-acetyltransferase